MDIFKLYSKRSFWTITIFAVLFGFILCAGVFLCADWISVNFSKETGQETVTKNIGFVLAQTDFIKGYYYKGVVPVVMSSVLLLGWLVWIVLRVSVSGVLKDSENKGAADSAPSKRKKDFIDQKIEQDRKRRLFLHTLSVFQREGRLLDFFDEDLNVYEDEQIGAAVRSIQEDCKKAVRKYIDPKPVIEKEEGDSVVIEDGFDMDAINLVGNVSGTPPFEGVLKHRGWKAGKKEIPKLSDIQDSTVITPAEIEIQ